MTALAGAAHLLSDLTIVELSDTMAGAFCGRMLAFHGARVIRVLDRAQPPRTSTESRPLGPLSATDLHTDVLKERRWLDLSDAADRIQLAELIAGADAFITDLEAPRLARLDLVPEDLRRRHAHLICTHITPFGRSGPKAGWRADDINIQAFAGFCSMVGSPAREPLMAPYALAFTQGGLHAASATVAAVLTRALSGAGGIVDVAIGEVLGAIIRMYSLVCRFYDIPPKRAGRRAPGSAGRYPCSLFPCKDGYIVLTSRSGKQWRQILAMMGNPAWAEAPRYQDSYGIAMEYPDEVDALVIPWMMQRTRAELMALGLEHGVPLGQVRRIDEVLADPQFDYRRFFQDVLVGKLRVKVSSAPAQIVEHGNGQRLDRNPPAATVGKEGQVRVA